MTEILPVAPVGAALNEPPQVPREIQMRHAPQAFETVLLTEMLKHAGVGQMPGTFNGGVGEAAFADMLTREYAHAIARSGSFGLAESVFGAIRELER